MGDAKPGESGSGVRSSTLEISLSSAIIAIAGQIPDGLWRQIVSILAPPLGYGIAFLIRLGFEQYKHRRLVKGINMLIADLQREINQPSTSPARKRELQKEVDELRKLLQKRLIDNLEIDIE